MNILKYTGIFYNELEYISAHTFLAEIDVTEMDFWTELVLGLKLTRFIDWHFYVIFQICIFISQKKWKVCSSSPDIPWLCRKLFLIHFTRWSEKLLPTHNEGVWPCTLSDTLRVVQCTTLPNVQCTICKPFYWRAHELVIIKLTGTSYSLSSADLIHFLFLNSAFGVLYFLSLSYEL